MTESTRRWSMAIAMATLIAGGAVGCTGSIGARASGSGAGAGVGTVTGSGAGTGTGGQGNIGGGLPPVPVGVFVPAPASLRRLTIAQYANSIHDLFGASGDRSRGLRGGHPAGRLRLDRRRDREPVATRHGAVRDGVARHREAGALGHGPTRGARWLHAGRDDRRCVYAPVSAAHRASRLAAALTDEELGRYGAIARNAQTVLGNFFGGLEYGLAGLLQSPHFIYRVELGAPDAQDPARVVFDDYELATRLSFFLWNTTPDDALLDAADARQLATGDGLLAQTQRLLASTRVSAAMQTFFTELYRLEELDALAQLPSMFPLMTATLGASMRDRDAALPRRHRLRPRRRLSRHLRFARDVRERRAGQGLWHLRDHRLEPGAGDACRLRAARRPARTGELPGHPFGIEPRSPTRRGKFIREMLLCQGIPAAPPGVEPLPGERHRHGQAEAGGPPLRRRLPRLPPGHGPHRARAGELRRHRCIPHHGRRADHRRERRSGRRGVRATARARRRDQEPPGERAPAWRGPCSAMRSDTSRPRARKRPSSCSPRRSPTATTASQSLLAGVVANPAFRYAAKAQ